MISNMMKAELVPSEMFPTFPSTKETEFSCLRVIDDFVYLPAMAAQRADLEECMSDFEVVDGSLKCKEDSEWIDIPSEPKVSADLTIHRMLELPYNKEEWWKQAVIGFPIEMRGAIWSHFITPESKGLKEKYIQFLNEECEKGVEKDINKDINRTFAFIPGFVEHQGMRLCNVLKAYSRLDPEVGYCQGMNYIAGLMLLYIDDEAVVFCLLADILAKFRWRELYVDGMPKLIECVKTLEKRIESELPVVHAHFEENDVNMCGLFSHFFITTFLYSVPFTFGVRVFELFLIEGEKAIMECIINMLRMMKEQILSRKCDTLHEYIKTEMATEFFARPDAIALLVYNLNN
eukprot:TRINITY_DN5040_c0_g2_i1.p1 TRINITY_DN5040_c0_g2~~TRINITY_DN5040_c0_g2_i1.p1  ORF type:complete len:347 (-),score=95.85 TRINITY_DN5040_c0_g2_i1:371-1411(-)